MQRFAYDEFGNETQGAPGTGFPFRYTGQRFDPESGLYYYKARYYSARLGRFLQTDPIGCDDDLNLYAHAKNDPIGKIDPTGTTAIDEIEETLPIIPWTAPEIVITGVRDDTEKLLVLNNPREQGFEERRKDEDDSDCPGGNGVAAACALHPVAAGLCTAAAAVMGLCLLLKGDTKERDDADCKEEWAEERKWCSQELAKPKHQQDRHRTGGYANVEDCARGNVSERCGGNPVARR